MNEAIFYLPVPKKEVRATAVRETKHHHRLKK